MCPHTDALTHGNTCTHIYTCKTNGSGAVFKTILILNTLSGSTLLEIWKIIKLWSERKQGVVRRDQGQKEKTVVNKQTTDQEFPGAMGLNRAVK